MGFRALMLFREKFRPRGVISIVSNKTKNQYEAQFSIKHALESLRVRIVDTESVAHAAEDTLQYLPYIPRAPHQAAEPDEDVRINFGRLHSLVIATSANARKLLEEVNDIIERLYQQPSSSNGGSSKAGEPWRPSLYNPKPEGKAAAAPVNIPVITRKSA